MPLYIADVYHNIKIGNSYVYYKTFHNNGINYIADLLTNESKFKSLDQIKNDCGQNHIDTNYLQYESLIQSIKAYANKLNLKINDPNICTQIEFPFIPHHIKHTILEC